MSFLVIQVALAVVIESSLFLRDPEDGTRRELLSLRQRPPTPLWLALGTSRTANGLCTEGDWISGGTLLFNYGITGSDLPEQALRLRRLLADGVRPHAVGLEILPAHLAQQRYRLEERTERLCWSDFSGLRHLDLPLEGLLRRWVWARALPIFSARTVLLSRWLPWLLPEEVRLERFWQGVSAGGWRVYGRERVSAEEYRRGLEYARNRYAELLRHFRIRKEPDRALRDMLEVCRGEHIPVVLYLMPEAPVFRQMYTAKGQAVLDAYLGELHREFGVRVIDAREWLPDDAFADGHHLLRAGAAAFTARFMRELAREEGTDKHGSNGFPRIGPSPGLAIGKVR
jgi:hypothetical protein